MVFPRIAFCPIPVENTATGRIKTRSQKTQKN